MHEALASLRGRENEETGNVPTSNEITMVFATAIISGLMLSHAFRVGNFSSLARILRTILILLFAFLIGSSTLWLGKSAPMLIPVIIIGFLITLGLRKDFFKVGFGLVG